MFIFPSIRRQPEFRQGVRDMSSVAIGIGAWGLMTGVAMVKSGMSVIESVAMTLLVYAGSSQLAAIPLLIAGATAVAAFTLPLKLNIVAGIGVAVLLCFWLEKQFGLDPDAEDDK